jgi:hypothetical protein
MSGTQCACTQAEGYLIMQAVLEQNIIAESVINRTDGSFGKKIGIIGTLFGCWHKDLSRPFTNKRVSYRTCLQCGARRKFDTRSLETSGPFYYPPKVVSE